MLRRPNQILARFIIEIISQFSDLRTCIWQLRYSKSRLSKNLLAMIEANAFECNLDCIQNELLSQIVSVILPDI
jgi:hypothetical protein